jgi:hypothetical protein
LVPTNRAHGVANQFRMDPTTKQHDVNTRLSAAQSVIQSWLERVLNDWGAAKQWCCRLKLAEKRTEGKFQKLVILSLNQVSET